MKIIISSNGTVLSQMEVGFVSITENRNGKITTYKDAECFNRAYSGLELYEGKIQDEDFPIFEWILGFKNKQVSILAGRNSGLMALSTAQSMLPLRLVEKGWKSVTDWFQEGRTIETPDATITGPVLLRQASKEKSLTVSFQKKGVMTVGGKDISPYVEKAKSELVKEGKRALSEATGVTFTEGGTFKYRRNH